MANKLLVVVDAQNDFITGSLGSMNAEFVAGNIAEKIRNWDGEFAFTMDTHDSNYLNTLEGKNLPVEHCLIGTDGFDWYSEIKQAIMELKVPYITTFKTTFGTFDLIDKLKYTHFDEIQLIGYCTDICVIANAIILKTYFSDTKITVDSECCAGSSRENHMAALQVMRSLQIEIV